MIKEDKDKITFFTSSNNFDVYFMEHQEEFKIISDFLNNKKYRASDTGLTYRKINHLSKNILCDDNRKNGEWRKFSFKELVFIKIIEELRGYGFIDRQLSYIKKAFCSKDYIKNIDFVFSEVFSKIQIFVIITSSGEIFFYNEATKYVIAESYDSYLSINFNNFVMDLWVKLGHKKIESKSVLEGLVSDKEEELINIIRNEDYKTIAIKKDNNCTVVRAGGEKQLSNEELIKIIRTKSFGNIEIVKRDGKVVNVKVEDVFKLS